ncbi:tetratricopeptide repeat-containing sulfotransferase family protein [Bauldia litoralis]|uniref:tetratricopeptide repeat-containing sulfotransferase family protein n=3 Tax=Bauldia litoralis TaxID=665467 RepID=UPI003262F668
MNEAKKAAEAVGAKSEHKVSPGLIGAPPAAATPAAPAQGGQAPAAPQAGGPQKTTKVTLDQALAGALKQYGAGRLDVAERICNQIISVSPRVAMAHNLLGAIQIARGEVAAAVKSFQRAVSLDPNNAQFHANLGETERQRGKLREAGIALRRAVELNPQSAQAFNNLGIVAFDRRDFAEAVDHYRHAIALNTAYPEAQNNLGNALRMLGENDAALEAYQEALLIRENYPEAYNNLATVLREQGQMTEAEHAYRKAIELKPGYMDAYNNLAILLGEEDRLDEALRTLGQALEVNPRAISTLNLVGRTQLKKGNYSQAEQACRLAIKIAPDNPESYSTLGEVYNSADRFTDAIAAYEAALARKPDLWETLNLYGVCLKSVGRMDEAREAFRKSLEFNPDGLGCYNNLADLESFGPDNKHFQTMKRIIGEAADPMDERYTPLHFALGKAYDDVGEYEKAIEHYIAGATLKRARLDYDEAETFAFFDAIQETFTKEFLENPPFQGDASQVPVFIVGMPRTGSSLIEQIIASHPQAFGAGEIKEFNRRLGALRGRFPALPKYPKLARRMSRDHYKLVADGYLSSVRALAPSADRITDKLLTNYYFVGLLHVMFPKAKFIQTRRNPVDACLSCYSKLFHDDMPHSYDFGELGRYYRKYADLMAHWEAVLPPGTMTTVVYEEVVSDVERNARDLIDFIGLPWDEACLAFHESARPVKTASVVQVRRPVYTTSVERWRRYGPAVQPLIESLGFQS